MKIQKTVTLELKDWVESLYKERGYINSAFIENNKYEDNICSFFLPPGNTEWMMDILSIIQDIQSFLSKNDYKCYVNAEVINNNPYISIHFGGYRPGFDTIKIKG